MSPADVQSYGPTVLSFPTTAARHTAETRLSTCQDAWQAVESIFFFSFLKLDKGSFSTAVRSSGSLKP